MTTALAIGVAAVLAPIAGLPVLWAFGITWPLASEQELARTVGGPGLNPEIGEATKFIVTILAAGAILASAVLPLLHVRVLPNPLPDRLVFWLLALQAVIFLLRGYLGYSRWSPATVEPFRRYNRHYYSPLIIALGLICLVLLAHPVVI